MIIGIPTLSAAAALFLAVLSDAIPTGTYNVPRNSNFAPWGKIKNIVVFGDSYTDEGRLSYFINNNGEAPPVGYIQPEGLVTASGGKVWARFAAESTGVTLYNYAVSGAVCSNDLTWRTFPLINRTFPGINDYELPAFKADFPKNSLRLDMDETLFTIWIGTNDLGGDAIISGLPDVGLTNYTSCVIDTMSELYQYGARNFALLNLAPLEHAPVYAPESEGGFAGPSPTWEDRGDNATAISRRMRDLTQGANEIYKYRIPFEVVAGSLKGAKVAVMDTYGLMTDIRNNPAEYLTGPLPLNVTGYNIHCDPLDTSVCTTYRPNDRDSFMWFDQLHPSEETSRVIGEEFANVLEGKLGEWITYW
ncbi:hypothetical protein Q9L58_004182 [Maublancomyces gigas]|uniref:Uncharacterized protein n=1 Tax=Discina gigas TaxID=1032678 RepID=A0ABR3GLN4_9PEZI